MSNREILSDIIANFSSEKFIDFFRKKNTSFRPSDKNAPQYNDDDFTDALYMGEISFDVAEKLIIYAFRVNRDLTERSGKKAQYEKGKRILKEQQADGGIFIFYDSSGRFRFSLIHINYTGTRRQWSSFKRFTYFVSPEETNKTFLQRIGDGDFSSLERIKEAFSVERVTKEFFDAYRYALKEVIIKSLPEEFDYNNRFSFSQLLLSRILFIYFLQKKGWFKWKDYVQDRGYIKNLWLKYKEWKNKYGKQDLFYSQWLSSLFFSAFNKKSHLMSRELPEEINESFNLMPFLNGGLFSRTELDELEFDISDAVFEWLFEPDDRNHHRGFLEIFNFTIDEASPIDVEVAVDPEMLGKVYESLIAEEERGSSGIFYTPRIEIDFMCRLSLVEYLHSKTGYPKDNLIDIIFNPSAISNFDLGKLKTIKSSLDKLKIVDPAVGSASFLVGMMNVLVELHAELTRKIENREENLFAIKQRIIQENLYGVDVNDWAVMVGELRLWLSLIIETEERYMDIYTKPLLPNLSFKIRQGDSLVEEIGGMQINIRGESQRYITSSVKNKIQQLIDRKNAFFSGGRSADLKEIREVEEFEQEIFTEILQAKIDEIKAKTNSLEQEVYQLKGKRNIFGEEDKKAKDDIKERDNQLKLLKSEIERYQKTIDNLKAKTKKDYFLWEIDFAEVFGTNGGFDIVIGNPPYVRQELVAPPLEIQKNYADEQWRNLKNEYKDKLISSVKNIWNNVKKIDKKSDLYVYFYYHGLSLLNQGGIFCFINSNSWLDVGYGAGLQEFLLKNMHPLHIIDNLKKRSFKQADVNTVIVLIERPKEKLNDYPLKFVAFKKPFEEVITADVIKEIEKTNQPVFDNEDFRIYPKTKRELLLEGVEEPEEKFLDLNPEHLPYIGNKWGGKYLRAPEIYFKIWEKGKGKLVRLGDIAEVKRGFTTGANEFFYLKPVGTTVKDVVVGAGLVPARLIRVKNSAGWEGEIEAEFLKPVIKSPRELKTIIVKLEDLNYLVFMCHKSERELKGTKALDYIKWGEKQKYQNRPTCRRRARWWDLGEGNKPTHIWQKSVNDRHLQCQIPFESFVDQRLYEISYPSNPFLLTILFNSTPFILIKELCGRVNLGQGALDTTVFEANSLIILDPVWLTLKNHTFEKNKLIKRNPLPIFTELGFDPNKPIREQEPNPLPDRKSLDDIVFDALGLTEEERKEVYWAVAELVKNRLEKAKSV